MVYFMSQCFRGSCESFATKDLDCFSDLTDTGLYSYFLCCTLAVGALERVECRPLIICVRPKIERKESELWVD